jgi:hypothetical protein
MRATQFVRRGLIASAAVATLMGGFAGMAGAQGPAIEPNGSAVVWSPIPGYTYEPVHTPSGDLAGVLATSTGGGTFPVVVRFMPDIDGAAVINLVEPDVIAPRQP